MPRWCSGSSASCQMRCGGACSRGRCANPAACFVSKRATCVLWLAGALRAVTRHVRWGSAVCARARMCMCLGLV
jgi:hypothetical protein